MFEGLIVKGALMAIGGGVGTVIALIVGWNIVQFVLAKYGKGTKKDSTTPNAVSIAECNDCKETHANVIREEFTRFREEFKSEIHEERETFKDGIEKQQRFIRDEALLDAVVFEKCQEFKARCAQAGIQVSIIETYRSVTIQAAYYSQGRRPLAEVNILRSKAGLWPITEKQNRKVTWTLNSIHFYSCAFDFAILIDGKMTWNTKADFNENDMPDYEEAGKIAKECGLEWGGDFDGKADMVHCQYTAGLTMDELAAGKRPADINT
jgi:peptidoglycan L-alanyl-D-glutamate endopeptidase CwlK